MAAVSAAVEVPAAPGEVWHRLFDWERQGEWMLLTRVHAGAGDGHRVGSAIEAFTGVGPVGVRDHMTVVVWDPPVRCVVRHTGRLVRGSAAFEVDELGAGRSRVTWSEYLDLPLGLLGRLGWPLVHPLVRAGMAWSLRRFARRAAAR